MTAATVQLQAGQACYDANSRKLKLPVGVEATVLKDEGDHQIVRTVTGQVLIVPAAEPEPAPAKVAPRSKPRRSKHKPLVQVDERVVSAVAIAAIVYLFVSAAAFGWVVLGWLSRAAL